MKPLPLFSLFFMFFWGLSGFSATQTEPILRVGCSNFPPFILLEQGEAPKGYSIDLWEALAREKNLKFKWVPCNGVKEKLGKLDSGELDVAIGGITITRTREEKVDFTYPSFRTGLDILVPQKETISIWHGLAPLFTRSKLFIVGGFLLLIIISGHLMWLAERGKEAFNDNYFPGVFEGMYWAIVTASTVGYGDKAPAKWAGRALACLVIVISLPLFALFTAEIASSFAIQQFRYQIQGPEDLVRHRVGVVEGTTSADFISGLNIRVIYFDQIDHAFGALENGALEAIVYDAPILKYYASKQGAGKVRVVGKLFHPQTMGFALPNGSAMREGLNVGLLALEESGEIETIRKKWFGNL